jgi:aspartate carbamoyltransferase catalytic subunit
MKFKGTSIISLRDFDRDGIMHVLESAGKIDESPSRYADRLKGRVLATLFFEPSTRTRLSFESAMLRLGGEVMGFSDAKGTSAQKGESLADSIKIVESYSDIIVLRHPVEGSARLASEISIVPIINGGDGANQHPSQTFLDLYTILKAKKKLDRLKVGFMGDLKYGRTVHSLAYALALFNARMYFISPPLLPMPSYQLEELDEMRVNFSQHNDFDDVKKDLDILYVTRIQRERFGDDLDYEKVKEGYFISEKTLDGSKRTLKILHPLPRVDELSEDVDKTDHALYFQQAANGIPVRMALLCLVTGAMK